MYICTIVLNVERLGIQETSTYNTIQGSSKRGGQGGGMSPCQDVVELLKISAIRVIYVRSRIRKYSRLISGNF